MRRLSIGLLLLLSGFCLLGTRAVQACSGVFTERSIEEALQFPTVIVKATIIDVDDRLQNFIVNVEQYYLGERQDRFLLVYRFDPAITANNLQYEDVSCQYLTSPFDAGSTGYFLLNRLPNGAYEMALPYYPDDFVYFPDSDGDIHVWDDQAEDYIQLSEAALIKQIVEFTGEQPYPPRTQDNLPLKTPLLVTTQNGTRYLIPIDGDEPILFPENSVFRRFIAGSVYASEERLADWTLSIETCDSDACITLSSDESRFAIQNGNNVELGHVAYPFNRAEVKGQGYLFSPDSKKIAIWNVDKLEVYAFKEFEGDAFIQSVTLNHNSGQRAALFHGQAIWHPDSNGLIYTDEAGLWLWYPLDIPDARLLVPRNTYQSLKPLYFSPRGRYIVYEFQTADSAETQLATLDIFSGQILPGGGAFSPDERTQIQTGIYEGEQAMYYCYLPARETFCHHPTTSYFEEFEVEEFKQVVWLNRYEFYAIGCQKSLETLHATNCLILSTEVLPYSQLGPGGLYPERLWRDENQPFITGYTMAYEPREGLLAIAETPSSILIMREMDMVCGSFFCHPDYTRFDLNHVLDSDIASIEWMPSLFFNWEN